MATEDETVLTLINHFESAYVFGRLTVRGVDIPDHATLAEFYEGRRFEPIWIARHGEGRQAGRLRQAIAEAEIHGLAAWRYHLATIDAAAAAEAWGDVELLLSQALLAQARHRALGVVDPALADPKWLVKREPADGLELLRAVARGANVRRSLNRLWPQSADYWRLLEAKQQLLASPQRPDPKPVPTGVLLKPGMEDARVPALRERLLGIRSPELLFDLPLADAVIAFQSGAGLEPDGFVGPSTREALNWTRTERMNKIDANLERWRWLPNAIPSTYIRVNIADFRLFAVRRDRTELDMPVIVGRPYRQTPVFTETMKYLVFNPFWDVPTKLAVEDELPRLQADASAMAAAGFEAAPTNGGAIVPVDAIDWQPVRGDNFAYRLRQRPGPANPLGRIKFMLPNEHAIYLHDTPARALFQRAERSYSSGCIRVADASALAEWALRDQKGTWGSAQIETIISSAETRTVVLDAPIPVLIVYFTAYPAASGQVVLQRDIYQRDARIISSLNDGAH